jgi:hypothetical protein
MRVDDFGDGELCKGHIRLVGCRARALVTLRAEVKSRPDLVEGFGLSLILGFQRPGTGFGC